MFRLVFQYLFQDIKLLSPTDKKAAHRFRMYCLSSQKLKKVLSNNHSFNKVAACIEM